MKKIPLILLSGLLSFGAGWALADTDSDSQAQTLDRFDTELGEAEGTPSRFSKLDVNSDGVISSEEAKRDIHLNAAFTDVDDNDDGRISAEEFSEWKGGFID